MQGSAATSKEIFESLFLGGGKVTFMDILHPLIYSFIHSTRTSWTHAYYACGDNHEQNEDPYCHGAYSLEKETIHRQDK